MSHLSLEQRGSILCLDDVIPGLQRKTVRNILRDKHPPGKPAYPEALLSDTHEVIYPIISDNLDGESIHHAALCILRVLQAFLVLMPGEDYAPHSNQPLKNCAMLLLQSVEKCVPLIFILKTSVPFSHVALFH